MKTQSYTRLFVLAAFTLIFGTAAFAQGAYCDPQWQVKSATVPPIEKGGVFFDGRQFVNYGWAGTLMTSPDGESWTLHRKVGSILGLRSDIGLTAGLFGNGHYALFVDNYAGQGRDAYVSTDLQHWERTRPMY